MVAEHAWIKYALMAVLLHAAILVLPISNQVQDRVDRVIEVVVMRQEIIPASTRPLAKPLVVAQEPARREFVPEIHDKPRPDIPPPEDKRTDKENAPPGGGNVLDERIIAQLTPGPDPGNGGGVAISGLATRGGTVGLGTGGGRGSAASLSGNAGASGTGAGGSGGSVDAAFGQPDGPQFVYRAMPEYPFVARRLRKEGRVVLLIVINEKGELQKIDVVETSDQMFVLSAIEAVKRSTFLPAKRKGVPVTSRATLPVRFALRD